MPQRNAAAVARYEVTVVVEMVVPVSQKWRSAGLTEEGLRRVGVV